MTTHDALNRRVSDLLQDPRETLDVEIKSWLNLTDNIEHKALIAKAIIALANHGGGFIVIGFEETHDGVIPADNRPDNLGRYTPDSVNAAVNRYVEPPFHCDVELVTSPQDGAEYPVIIVPGGHHFPIRSRRGGPGGNVIRNNTYYIRRPGPQSEPPQSGQEWDALIRQCISNARDDLFNTFRLLMAGGTPTHPEPEDEIEQVNRWFSTSNERWEELTEPLPVTNGAHLQHGHYAIGYKLFAENL